MKFCTPHWNSLREEVDKRGLSALVAENGDDAERNLLASLEEGITIDTFDPLLGAHNLITSNAMRYLQQAGVNPMVMMDPVAPAFVQCPICCLNKLSEQHDQRCTNPECIKGRTFEWMIERSVDDMVEMWKEFGVGS